jgi:small subunit ribosomal protein S11
MLEPDASRGARPDLRGESMSKHRFLPGDNKNNKNNQPHRPKKNLKWGFKNPPDLNRTGSKNRKNHTKIADHKQNKTEHDKKPESRTKCRSEWYNKQNDKQKGNYKGRYKKKFKKDKFKKKKRLLPAGIAYIKTTSNNIIVTISTLLGTVVCWTSAGSCGFKGARKSTNFAAKKTAQTAAQKSLDKGLKQLEVRVNGLGRGRETAIRGLMQTGIDVCVVRDISGLPYNGCRAPKKRRL